MMRCSALVALAVLTLIAAGAPATGDDDDDLEARRQRVQTLTPEQKDDLLRKKKRFDELRREDQDRLRSLHDALSSDPNSERLRQVMLRYNQWLRTLSPRDRALLASMPVDERVHRVSELMTEQESQQFRAMTEGKLGPKDMHVIITWLEEFVGGRESEIVAALPPDAAWVKTVDDLDRRRRLLVYTLIARRNSEIELPGPSQDDILNGLAPRLSREAQKFLERLPDGEERERIARVWIRAAVFSRMPRPLSPERVEQMIAELDPNQREYLESLPRNRMYSELQRIYYSQRFGNRGPRFGPGGPGGPGSGRGGPPGGSGGRGRSNESDQGLRGRGSGERPPGKDGGRDREQDN